MTTISVFDAKTRLSRVIEALQNGETEEVVITRHGRPVARMLPMSHVPVERRIGVARGLQIPDDIDRHNSAVAALFGLETT